MVIFHTIRKFSASYPTPSALRQVSAPMLHVYEDFANIPRSAPPQPGAAGGPGGPRFDKRHLDPAAYLERYMQWQVC